MSKTTLAVGFVALAIVALVILTAPKASPVKTTPGTSNSNLFLQAASAVAGLLPSIKSSSTTAVGPVDSSGVPINHGGGGTWDSGSSNYLPAIQSSPAYVDDTSHDNLLS
jgi:hypothetical protein